MFSLTKLVALVSNLKVALPAGLSVLRIDQPKGSQDIFVEKVVMQ